MTEEKMIKPKKKLTYIKAALNKILITNIRGILCSLKKIINNSTHTFKNEAMNILPPIYCQTSGKQFLNGDRKIMFAQFCS